MRKRNSTKPRLGVAISDLLCISFFSEVRELIPELAQIFVALGNSDDDVVLISEVLDVGFRAHLDCSVECLSMEILSPVAPEQNV